MIFPFKQLVRNRQRQSRQSSTAKRSQSFHHQHSHHRKVVASRSFHEKFRIYTGEQLHWVQVTQRLLVTVIHGVLPWMLWCGGYGLLICLLDSYGKLPAFFNDSKVLQNVVISFNIILSLLLVFRTNTAHDRFWEGRKLWGAMVNTTRNLARGISIAIEQREPSEQDEKGAAVYLVAAFAVAMKLHLRREPMNSELEPMMSPQQYHQLQNVNHAPLEIAYWIGDYLQHQFERQRLNIFQLASLHELLDDMVDILGGCERILKTPVPLVYTITLNTLLWIYFLLLPFQLVGGLKWWTAPILVFMSFLYLGINEVGAEIEEPFGHDANDLPLDSICTTIVRNLEHMIQFAPSARASRTTNGNVLDLPRKAA
jgi:putative membrane protein